MTLNVITWNSNGDRADGMWSRLAQSRSPFREYLPAPVGTAAAGTGLLIFVCEAGTPPWVNPAVSLTWGKEYGFRDGASGGWLGHPRPWFAAPAHGSIGEALLSYGRRGNYSDALWVPWQRTVDGAAALRCSVALYWFPPDEASSQPLTVALGRRYLYDTGDLAGRPVLTAAVRVGTAHRLTGLFGHLPASQSSAPAALRVVASAVGEITPEGTSAFVAGDLNVDALRYRPAPPVPAGWTAVRTGQPTQRSGGELDWGIAKLVGMGLPTVKQLWPYGPTNLASPATSDHSALLYQFA